MRRILSVLAAVLIAASCLVACDNSSNTYAYCICLYSGEFTAIPVKGKCTYDGGYSTTFYSELSIFEMKDNINEIEEDAATYQTELFMQDRYLLVKKITGQLSHYSLLTSTKSEARKGYIYHFNNMSGGDYGNEFLIPYHLIDDETVVNNYRQFFYGGLDFMSNNKYSIAGDLDTVYEFYNSTNAFDIEKTETSLMITVDIEKATENNSQRKARISQDTLVINFSTQNAKTFVSFAKIAVPPVTNE